jgi:hypothetical protein
VDGRDLYDLEEIKAWSSGGLVAQVKARISQFPSRMPLFRPKTELKTEIMGGSAILIQVGLRSR